MVGEYEGHFSYNNQTISLNAPDSIGVYYMGRLNPDNRLGTLYVGRALGEGVTIKSRLLNHLNNKEWSDIRYFGYKACSTQQEVEDLEKAEILRLNPIHNQRVG